MTLTFITTIPDEEKDLFADFIREARSKYISSPKDTVLKVLEDHKELLPDAQQNIPISPIIKELREHSYNYFLVQESAMNAYILKHISEKFSLPKQRFDRLYDAFMASNEHQKEKLKTFFGEYAGHIYPYIYALSLSNTQSRRSRAGKVFEGIIYALYEALEYPYESQATVGSKTFKEKHLGKIVDSLLPNLAAFEGRRDKVVIGTMKTTLRERWQEVIEEATRTGLPSIYLLTADDDISGSKAEQMSNHNVILVVYDDVKTTSALSEMHNVISFEDYFYKEIPDKLKYWSGQ